MSRREKLLIVALLAFIVVMIGVAIFVVADNIDRGNDVEDSSLVVRHRPHAAA